LLTTLKKTEESLRRLIKGKKQPALPSCGSEAPKLSDEDKVRLQIELDIGQYKEQVIT
jgi:hypothetical protein